jgi:hypothetical protein
MTYRKTAVLIILLAGLALSSPPGFPGAVNFQASLQSETVAVGFKAVVMGTAGPGSRITVTVAGTAVVPSAGGMAEASGSFAIPVGPFQAKGTYGLTVQSGSEQKSLVVEVVDQVAEGAVAQGAEEFNQANNEALAALENSLNVLEEQISLFPPNDPGIPAARQGINRLREHCRELPEIMATITQGNTEFAAIVARPTFQYSWQDMTDFYRQRHEELHASAQQLNQVADPAELQGQSDWCARALKAKAVFLVINTIVERWRSTLSQFLAEKVTGFLAGLAAGTVMRGAGQIDPSGRPTPLQEQVAINLAQSTGEAIFARMTSAAGKLKANLILEAIDFAVNTGLDVYMSYKCLTFTGRIKGHVHVEALDGKTHKPFWGQDNDWEGDVTLTCAKPESSDPVPIWGIIHGKGKNFIGTNMLSTLFPKTLANALFLTTQPRKFNQALAYFAFRLEGAVGGNTINLKLGSKWVDMFDGLFSTFSSIVIPFGSPIPLVQTHKIPFQNAAWQLSRTFSSEGTKHPITSETSPSGQSQRRVKDQKSRELASPGARGVFTLKVDLCAGCPSDWKPDI